jgi:hypothetical protein
LPALATWPGCFDDFQVLLPALFRLPPPRLPLPMSPVLMLLPRLMVMLLLPPP